MTSPLFGRIAFIGIGLIGSSLARVIRRTDPATHIGVCARSQATLDTAMRLGLADAAFTDPAACVQNADLVVICTPIGAYKAIAQAISGALKPGAVVTDVGSVKSAVIRDVAPYLPDGVAFVPGHPIAGTEHSGPEAGFAELFENHWVILTPPRDTDPDAVARVGRLWRNAGSTVEIMAADHHDRVLAITSHLPHLIAYTIVGTATDLEEDTKREVIKFSASGFRDFTRIAASDPVMWRDIFMNNKDAVLDILGRFSEDLTALQRAIRRGEGDTLQELFTRTREIRRGVIDYRQDKIDVKTPDADDNG
ncbi:prephenate/arogenate dehydrogenase family protein [Varunaivibrio sulfuroxidans]|uniref:prephenate dehydrogenase n=1 Tax=Varunaivibrio sulfuroxidans TaxID=1773489 RepID=A0A4R3J8C2_9PROT|nr:prephenate/arogenate dehydrogenase family protein [Varunaivibrio sulfuroxidans]TCS61704.1 prephenate dehydrogenase [Varunaivibrio sulfuroxidans]WES32112.1 prephenate/arogenate dehydrogenase family protein [Varunaivibrio sulfuroxidans]